MGGWITKIVILAKIGMPLVSRIYKVLQDGKITKSEMCGVVEDLFPESGEIVIWKSARQ